MLRLKLILFPPPDICLVLQTRRQRGSCLSWMCTVDLLRKWFGSDRAVQVAMFVDAFSGSGFSRTTTAIKLSLVPNSVSLGAAPPPVKTACEYKGGEEIAETFLEVLQHTLKEAVTVKYLIVDHHCAQSLLNISGANANNCFVHSKKIGRSEWKRGKCMNPLCLPALPCT
jgi:hypothetical protein